ncbi:hypothetical protein CB1_001340006 [Camelus ferus]|nr:hypothetical protein CB1_001340006 [Camelus ferus]
MADPELLLSCGKDAKILCSNPNTGEVLYELPTNTQWCFDIQWCPRNPAVLSAASFDGRISVYSIMGGSTDGLRQKQVDKLSSSFGNLDPFGTGQPLPPLQIPQQTAQHSIVLPLKKPPKWIRRPVGASFSFGGKLVTFANVRPQPQQGVEPQALQNHVFISQVVTEKEFLRRSDQLQQVVQSQGFVSYCQKKIDASQTEFEKNVWSFLKVYYFFIADIDGLITQALLTGNFENAVDLCLHDNRMADAIILAIAGGQELLARTQKKYFAKSQSKITRDLIEKVVILRKAVQLTQAMDASTVGVLLAEKMSQYANLLAAQGSIAAALAFLPENTNQGENPPPPGFIMHGNVNPNVAAAQLPTSPGHMHTQVPPYPQPQPYQPAQKYSFGTGGSAVYRPQQPIAPSASNAYPNTPYIPSASSYSGQSQLYAAQHQASPPASSPTASFPPPPASGASFQHGGPGAPPSSSAYALPPGTTGPQNGWNDPPALNRVPKKKKHVQSLPTEKITKKPIPDEHLILKTTFEDLIQRCLSSASDPQTKRKLDDASKRLEFLYDKLREQTLSPTIISGLHNIARSIETRNYAEGLTIHTHIVSTSNFSETSAFMPVLKVVLTQANKLGV